MPFHCTHCGATFPSEKDKPRCPSCMRITTVIAVKAAHALRRPKGARAEAVQHPGASPAQGHPGVEGAFSENPGVANQGASDGSPPGFGSPPPPRLRGEGVGFPPWPLWVGVVLMAANLLAMFGTDFQSMEEGKRLGAAATFAALGGAGLALAVRGFFTWRPWR